MHRFVSPGSSPSAADPGGGAGGSWAAASAAAATPGGSAEQQQQPAAPAAHSADDVGVGVWWKMFHQFLLVSTEYNTLRDDLMILR